MYKKPIFFNNAKKYFKKTSKENFKFWFSITNKCIDDQTLNFLSIITLIFLILIKITKNKKRIVKNDYKSVTNFFKEYIIKYASDNKQNFSEEKILEFLTPFYISFDNFAKINVLVKDFFHYSIYFINNFIINIYKELSTIVNIFLKQYNIKINASECTSWLLISLIYYQILYIAKNHCTGIEVKKYEELLLTIQINAKILFLKNFNQFLTALNYLYSCLSF